ncbi:hypothetical protein BH20CHL5_BH20CHL5_07560 [soil metagenome]|jgi:hypothetical protein|nr:hypothetical protein [Chloroflexota bacterium]
MQHISGSRDIAMNALRADVRTVPMTMPGTDVAILIIATLGALRVELLGLIRGFRQEPGG